jgi:hypothetical protein
MLFLVTLHYKICGRPAPSPKTLARHVPWDDHGQNFLNPKNQSLRAFVTKFESIRAKSASKNLIRLLPVQDHKDDDSGDLLA